MRERPFITSVAFSDSSMEVTWTSADDLRYGGALAQQHTMMIAPHPDYLEQMDNIRDALTDLLEEAIGDFNSSERYVPPQPDDEDDEDKGMGD